MEEVRALEAKTIKVVIGATLILAAICFLVVPNPLPYIYGLGFGSAIGCLNFLLLSRTLAKAVRMHPSKAQGYATGQYFIRFVIYGVVLFVSILSPQVHVLGTVVGLLLIKVVIMATNLFSDKAYFQNIFKRKEED